MTFSSWPSGKGTSSEPLKLTVRRSATYTALVQRSPPSYTFSSTAEGRNHLRGKFWVHINAQVACHTSTRDLGGHFNVGKRMAATTLASRMHKATTLCLRLGHFPWSRPAKEKIISTLILPMAFYGCEVAKPPEKALARLSIAIAKCICYHSSFSSNLLAFHTTGKACLEPGGYVLLRRTLLLHRILTKPPEAASFFSNTHSIYTGFQLLGAATATDSHAVQHCLPASPLRSPLTLGQAAGHHCRTGGIIVRCTR